MKEISVEELKLNPSTLIGKEWALLTAGNKDGYNTMTVSWGQDRKSTRLNSSHYQQSRMPSSA